MKRLRDRRPSPAIVIALVALVAATTAPALAGPAERAVRTAKRALGIAKKADRTADRARRDARLARADAKEALGRVLVRHRDEPLPTNDFRLIRVECRSKEQVVSGGYTMTGFQGTDIERVHVFHNGPDPTVEAGEVSDAWIVGAVNRTVNSGGMRVYAMCARGGAPE